MRFEYRAEWLLRYSFRGRCGVKDCMLRCADLNTIYRGCTWQNRGREQHQRAKVFLRTGAKHAGETVPRPEPACYISSHELPKFRDDPTLAHQRYNDLVRSMD